MFETAILPESKFFLSSKISQLCKHHKQPYNRWSKERAGEREEATLTVIPTLKESDRLKKSREEARRTREKVAFL